MQSETEMKRSVSQSNVLECASLYIILAMDIKWEVCYDALVGSDVANLLYYYNIITSDRPRLLPLVNMSVVHQTAAA